MVHAPLRALSTNWVGGGTVVDERMRTMTRLRLGVVVISALMVCIGEAMPVDPFLLRFH